jgi:sugar phosphate isomerase/epimerase
VILYELKRSLERSMRNLSNDRSLLAINSATVKSWTLEQLVEGCARAGIGAIAPWRDVVQAVGIDKAGRLIREAGLTVSCYCRAGLFPAADDAGRRAALEDNRRAVDEAAAIGARCLVLIAGGLPKGSKDLAGAHRQVHDGLAALLPHARAAGMPLAIEPLHPMYAADRACVNTLAHTNELCDELGDGVGVAVDVYHVWWDPDLPRQIARAGPRILTYHVCDWLVPTKDLLLDRGMPGDGVIDLRAIRAMVEATGYAGHIDVEIFSENDWWKRDPSEVLRICLDRHQSVV